MQKQIEKLGKLIKNSEKILLINHIRMDGDAWGALSAMYGLLSAMGKNVRAVNDMTVPESFRFIAHADSVEQELDIATFTPDMIISLDASSIDQLGEQYTKYPDVFKNTPFVVIDHHVSNPGFGSLNIIDTLSSSTCELVYIISEQLKWLEYIDQAVATSLYTGIQTDTNMYFNANTTPRTLEVGAKLLSHGADFRLPVYECYKKKSFLQSKVWGKLLENMDTAHDGRLVYSSVTEQQLVLLGASSDDTGGFINEFLSNMAGSEICFLAYPLPDGNIKISMRCQQPHNVSKIAQSFGGGGHVLAAGFQSDKSLAETTEMLITLLGKEIL